MFTSSPALSAIQVEGIFFLFCNKTGKVIFRIFKINIRRKVNLKSRSFIDNFYDKNIRNCFYILLERF